MKRTLARLFIVLFIFATVLGLTPWTHTTARAFALIYDRDSYGRWILVDYEGETSLVSISSPCYEIAPEVFENYTSLYHVEMADSVVKIGYSAFAGCPNLYDVSLSANLTDLGFLSFSNCDSLESIVIPDSVTSIQYGLFSGCEKLSDVHIGSGAAYIDDSAFYGCSSLAVIDIPDNVESIGGFAFYKCTALENATIGSGVTRIDDYAFKGCGKLVKAYFQGDAPTMGTDVFKDCKPGFTVYYAAGKTGYASTWNGYPAYAYYPASPCTVTFNLNGAAGTPPASQSLFKGVIPDKPANPTRAGYIFAGWYRNAACTGAAWNFSADQLAGNTTLYAKWTRQPSAPATPAITAASASYNSVKVSWNQISGANGYQVYRATSSGGSYSKVYTATSGSTVSYTNTGLTTGKTYYYKVRAYRTVDGSPVYGSYSSVKSAKPVPAKPSITAASASYSSVKVSWNKISGASGYQVYRATSSGGSYSKVYTATSGSTVSYTNTGLTTGKTYYYKVRAYRTVDDSPVYGSYSSVKSAKPVPAKPSITAASASYSSVKVSWKKISGASGYQVYRATSSSGTYTKVYTAKSGSTVSYTNTDLTTGKTYYYKVRAYRTVGETKVYGNFSSVKSVKPVPATPTVTVTAASASSIKVSWKKVSGASGYEIYRATSSGGTYTKVYRAKSGSTVSYTDTGLTSGKTYYYKVRAYRTVGETKVYGKFSSVKSVKTK